jgi:hypothetical protein
MYELLKFIIAGPQMSVGSTAANLTGNYIIGYTNPLEMITPRRERPEIQIHC